MTSYKNKSYHKLIVYQKSKDLILFTYKITRAFPSDERFILVPQMRRCSISIAANVVEGYSKSTPKDFARFIDISIGSINELEFFFEIALELKYINSRNYKISEEKIIEVKKLLYSFQRSLRESRKK